MSEKFSSVLRWMQDKGRISEKNITDAVEQVRDALLEADVPYDVVEQFLEQIKKDSLGNEVLKSLQPGQQFIKVVYNAMVEFLGGKNTTATVTFGIPSVIMMAGLQGSGKTTSLIKLACRIQKDAEKKGKRRKILCASVDYYRPAAREQLRILAEQYDVDYYHAQSSDPVEAATEIYAYYQQNRYEHLLFDTAGRLHIDDAMMEELRKVSRIVKPKYTVLVLDAMTGQESLAVAQQFNETIGFDGAIISKMDSDARGGSILAFRYILKKPIYFVGIGEKGTDLERFIPDRIASRILGMGDILSLIEKADEKVKKEEQEKLAKRMMGGNFSLDDFAQQMSMVNKMGSLQSLARYMPGMAQLSPEMVDKGQKEMMRFSAIIGSMTKKERMVPQILDASRKKRIANGSGVQVSDINHLLEKFEQSKQFVKMFKKFGKNNSFFR